MFKWYKDYFLISVLVSDFKDQCGSVPSISVAVLGLSIIYLLLGKPWTSRASGLLYLRVVMITGVEYSVLLLEEYT